MNTNKLRPIALAIMTVTALAGCNDETTYIEQPKQTEDPARQMRSVFKDYQGAIDTLDNTTFGQVTDQMASSRQAVDRMYLDKLDTIDRSGLSDEDKIYYDTFQFDRNIAIRGASLPNPRFGNFDIPITHFYNYIDWNATTAGAKQKTADDYHKHLQVIREFTAWTNNLHSQYNMGMVDKAQLPKVLITRLVESTNKALVPGANDTYQLLREGLDDIQAHQNQYDKAFVDEYEKAVQDAEGAVKDLIVFLNGDYKDAARSADNSDGKVTDTNIGWGDLPNGQAWYQWQLDRNSTTGKPAMELSQLGEDLVADAKAEMIRVAELVVSKRGENSQRRLA